MRSLFQFHFADQTFGLGPEVVVSVSVILFESTRERVRIEQVDRQAA
jgi:hypothetical protein